MAGGLFYHDVFSALIGAQARFVVVGGVAVNLQGVPRFTADLDLAVALDGASLAAAADALTALGLRSRLPGTTAELRDDASVRAWIAERNLQAITFADPSQPLREVDLVVASPVPFEELERGADAMESGGSRILVASIDALIRMKTGTGRAQDDADVDALRRVQELSRGR